MGGEAAVSGLHRRGECEHLQWEGSEALGRDITWAGFPFQDRSGCGAEIRPGGIRGEAGVPAGVLMLPGA